MADRFCGLIRIGGDLRPERADEFLKAVCNSSVRLEWGEAYFSPDDVEELQDALKEGYT